MKILLIEDDVFWRSEILMYLDELNYDDLHVCKNATNFMNYLSTNTPDIIIADIILGNDIIFDSLDQELIKNIPIIFITTSVDTQFYEMSKNYPISFYLIKPFHKISLKASIETLIQKTNLKSEQKNTQPINSITVRGQYQEKIELSIDKIVFIRSKLAYCMIKTLHAQYVLKYSLQKFEKEFEQFFLKSHRAYLTNKIYIQKIDFRKMCIHTIVGEVPISRSYKNSVMKYYNETQIN